MYVPLLSGDTKSVNEEVVTCIVNDGGVWMNAGVSVVCVRLMNVLLMIINKEASWLVSSQMNEEPSRVNENPANETVSMVSVEFVSLKNELFRLRVDEESVGENVVLFAVNEEPSRT